MQNKPLPQKRYLKADALSSVRSGDIDGAIKKYEQYLELNPWDDDAWTGLGGAYRRKGNLLKAIENYEEAFKINPQSSYALVNIVSLRAARNTEEDKRKLKSYLTTAIKLIQEIITHEKGDFWTWYDLATLQLIKGETIEAIRTFNYAADLTPKTAKENFRGVLNNLNFLKTHNPLIEGISEVIKIIKRQLD